MKNHARFARLRLEPLEDRRLLAVTIDAGDHVLLPDTPNQEIEIYVSGGDPVNGVELYLQIADGGPEAGGTVDAPAITGADLLTGTIFSGNNTGQAGSVLVPQVAQFGTTTNSGTVDASGLLATVVIDTTGFTATSAGNPWQLLLSPTLAGNSRFPGTSTTVVNGTITINGNQAPTDIALSSSSLDENQPAGTLVGTLSTADPDVGDTFSYNLVAGEGDTDNGLFAVVGQQLQSSATFDHETQSSYSIRVRSTDDGGLSIEKVFVINIDDINDAPLAAAGGPYTVAEGGTTTLSAAASTDEDLPGDILTYAWDFDGDGQYDDAVGVAPVFSAADLDGTSPAAVIEVALKVTDSAGESDYDQAQIGIYNVDPSVSILNAPTSVRSGINVSLASAVTDPAPADTHTFQWIVEKGGSLFGSGTDSSFDFTPDEAGTFTVSLTVTDDDGGTGTDVKTVLVTNTGPVADAGGPYPVAEGGSVTLDASGSYDPDGAGETLLFAWDFDGDGEYDDASGVAPIFSAAAIDGTSPPVTVPIGLKVTDSSGDSNYDSTSVVVSNGAPTALILGAPATSAKGVQINLMSEVTDPAVADTFTYFWTVTRDGSPVGVGTNQNLRLTPQLAGTYLVSLTVTDDDGGEGTDSKTIVVENAAPVADAGGPYSVDEGGTVVLDASATTDSDLPNEVLTYAWDFDGDGQYDDATGVAPTFSAADLDGTSPPTAVVVGLEVTDSSGASDFDTAEIVVANVAPSSAIVGTPIMSPVGTDVHLTSSVSDAGVADTHSYLWEVSVDLIVVATGTEAGFSFTPTTHADYVITLTVSDDDQATTTDARIVRAVTELGPVDFRVEQIDLVPGSRFYALETTHSGYLTFEVTQTAPNDTVQFVFLDESLNVLAESPDVGAGERFDWQVGAGEVYSIALMGGADDVTLRITNLVHHSGTDVMVYGTSAEDTFDFNGENSRDVTINGVLYSFDDAEVRTVRFDGGAGMDIVTLEGSDYSESLVVGPQGEQAEETAVFQVTDEAAGDPFTVTATGFGQLLAWSRTGGHDVATFHDSADADKLKGDGEEEFVRLRKLENYSEFMRRAKMFEEVRVIADIGAENDRAVFFDSAGDDHFSADAKEHAYELSGPGYSYRADLIKQVLVRADYGGDDSAEFTDSAAIDKFRGTSVKAWLFSTVEPFSVIARRFDSATVAFPNGGYDKVRLFDSGQSEQFIGKQDRSIFEMRSVTYTETGAEYVLAYSEIREEETDSAELYKASLDDLYEELTDMTRLSYVGADRIIECAGFEQVDVSDSPVAASAYQRSVDQLMREYSGDE